MFSSNPMFKLLALVTLVILLAAAAFADTVRLKDGSIIKGKIVSFSGGKFVMVIGQGDRQREMTFFADEIDSIEFEGGSAPEGSPIPISMAGQQEAVKEPAKRPSFIEKTDGNQTIITVGSTRKENQTPPADNSESVDPNAVAMDPAEGTTDDGVIDDDTPIGGDPVGEDTSSQTPQPTSDDPTKPRPVQIKVSVLADNTANGWTNAGWVVKKGQKIRIISNGRISLGNGRSTGPGGISTLPDANKLIKDRPTGCLIAVIGDDNNDFIFIGENREFIAQRDGALFLGINEGNLNDNSGAFDTIVEVEAGN